MNRPQYYNAPRLQTGAGMVAWLVILGIVGLIAVQVFKLIPYYTESLTIDGKLKSLAEETVDGLESLSGREIKQDLASFYRVNGVSSAVEKGTTITRDEGHVYIDMDYEQRIPMFYNIDVVLSFKKHVNSKFPNKCCSPREKK